MSTACLPDGLLTTSNNKFLNTEVKSNQFPLTCCSRQLSSVWKPGPERGHWKGQHEDVEHSSGSICSPGPLMFKPEPGLPKLYNPGQITQAYCVSLFTKLKKEYITSRSAWCWQVASIQWLVQLLTVIRRKKKLTAV